MKPSLIYERHGHGSSISLVKKRASKKTAIGTAYKTETLDGLPCKCPITRRLQRAFLQLSSKDLMDILSFNRVTKS